jgi:hypothetical protein
MLEFFFPASLSSDETSAERPSLVSGLSFQRGQQKIRGSVNGNARVPRPDERTPLTTIPARRATVESLPGAYPSR